MTGIDPACSMITTAAEVAYDLIRLHSNQLCEWLQCPGDRAHAIRHNTRSIFIRLIEEDMKRSGPSCGSAIFVALLSLLTGCKVKPRIAMTGQITPTGLTLAIGDPDFKTKAAEWAGADVIVLPEENRGHIKVAVQEGRVKGSICSYSSNVLDVMEQSIEGQ